MTEYSYFWQVGGGGDVSLSPYDDTEMSKLFHMLFSDRTVQGVIPNHPLGNFDASNPVGLTFRVGPGAALVDGTYFTSDSNEDFSLGSGASAWYYSCFLRKTSASQVVRIAMSSPVVGGPAPSATQTAATWEIVIYTVVVAAGGGSMTINDTRSFLRSGDHQIAHMNARVGNVSSPQWFNPNPNYFPYDRILVGPRVVTQFGCVNWTGAASATGNVSVTFPYSYVPPGALAMNYGPSMLVQPAGTLGNIITSVGISGNSATIYWRDIKGTTRTSIKFFWMATGNMPV